MNRSLGSSLLVLGLIMSGGHASAQRAGSRVDSVTALVNAYDRAWNSSDTAAVRRILAPEYQYFTSRGGVESREAALEILASPEYRLERASRSEVAVRFAGPVAVVSSRWKGTGTYKGERFTDDQRCGQVWLRSGRTWQVLSEHCVQIVPTAQTN
jgi:ketosteroid isomerase-like protein